MGQEGPSEEVTVSQGLSEKSMALWTAGGKSVPGKGNSTDDGPEAESSFVSSRKRKKRLVWLQFGESGGREGGAESPRREMIQDPIGQGEELAFMLNAGWRAWENVSRRWGQGSALGLFKGILEAECQV